MKYKDDWDSAKRRFEAFWNREILDRCCISVTAPKKNAKPLEPIKDIAFYRTDAPSIIRRSRRSMEQTYYGGEAFPMIILDLGAAGHAGFFKGEKHLIGDTVWFFPSLEDPEDLTFDENSYLFRKTEELARAFVEDSRGDYCVSMPDTTGNADALAHLMGSEAFLEGMIENPDGITGALNKIEKAYERIMTDVYGIIRENNDGGSCVGWLQTWAPGFHAQMQCDLSVMISQSMFHTFIEPELRAQCRFLEYPLYHFDGIEQCRHLDTLLAIPELRVIQWTQVAGQPPCTQYIEELKRIQQAGKNLLICVSPDQIETLMAQLSSRGLYLLTSADSEEDAKEILKKVTQWTHD